MVWGGWEGGSHDFQREDSNPTCQEIHPISEHLSCQKLERCNFDTVHISKQKWPNVIYHTRFILKAAEMIRRENPDDSI